MISHIIGIFKLLHINFAYGLIFYNYLYVVICDIIKNEHKLKQTIDLKILYVV